MILFLQVLAIVLLTLGFSIIWAKVSRMCGGGAPKLPLGLDQHVYAFPFLVLSYLLNPLFTIQSSAIHFISYATAFLGKRMGHGQYFDLGKWMRKIKAEKIDIIVRLFFGKDQNTLQDNVAGSEKRDIFGLSLTGLVCGIGIAVAAFLSGHIIMGIVYLLFSSTKGFIYNYCDDNSYQVGKLFMKLGIDLDDQFAYTEQSEWINGFVPMLPIFASIFTLLILL